jgi:hypothetical protein
MTSPDEFWSLDRGFQSEQVIGARERSALQLITLHQLIGLPLTAPFPLAEFLSMHSIYSFLFSHIPLDPLTACSIRSPDIKVLSSPFPAPLQLLFMKRNCYYSSLYSLLVHYEQLGLYNGYRLYTMQNAVN